MQLDVSQFRTTNWESECFLADEGALCVRAPHCPLPRNCTRRFDNDNCWVFCPVSVMSWLCYLRKPAHLPRVSASLRLGRVSWPTTTRLSSQSWELPPEALRVARPSFSSTPAASRKLGTLRQTIPANLSFCSCLIDSFASHVLVQMAQWGGGGERESRHCQDSKPWRQEKPHVVETR